MRTSRRGHRSRRLWALAVIPLAAVLFLTTTTASATTLSSRLFAVVPSPGHPVGIVVADDGTTYVATHQDAQGGPGGPSHIFGYNGTGKIVKDFTITGQDAPQGLTNMAQDRAGLLYALDRHPARVITLDPRTGVQRTYATFPDVPPCGPSGPNGSCSATQSDQPAYPDDLAFGPDGSLYVTDISQALIWRIPPGGGAPSVWFTDSQLESVFGTCGLKFASASTLVVGQCLYGVSDPSQIATGYGRIYTLPIGPDGTPGALHMIWQGHSGEAPDGFALGASGRIYVPLALGNALMVLDPSGHEIARVTSSGNAIPWDNPASVAFKGTHALVTNQAFLSGVAADSAVMDVSVGEPGMPLYRP